MAHQTPIPQIFDRRLLAHRRTRAAADFKKHSFLHQRIATELAERLNGLDRPFATTLIIGSFLGLLQKNFEENKVADLCIEADLSAAMLPRKKPALVLDEERLPIADSSCDLIVSLWGLHHVNDLPGALIQIRRALKPSGVFLAAMAGSRTLAGLRDALLAAETEMSGGAGARIHPFADVRALGSVMQRARFTDPIVDSELVEVNYTDPMRLLADLRGMGESNCLTARPKKPLRREILTRAMAQCKNIEFEICYLMGNAPS